MWVELCGVSSGQGPVAKAAVALDCRIGDLVVTRLWCSSELLESRDT